MGIKVEMELSDAMCILGAFSSDSKNKEMMQKKGEEALSRMADQVDDVVSALEHQRDETSFH